MFVRVTLLVALVSVAIGSSDAMHYMDNVLKDLPRQASSIGLDPLRLFPFQLKVKGNGITNRDFKVNATQGVVHGLGSVVRRGDCAYIYFSGERKLSCNVTLNAVRIFVDSEVKGDSILANPHNISTVTIVENSTQALVEFQGSPGFFGRVTQVTVSPITLTTSVTQGKVDLNKNRYNDFVKQFNTSLATQLSAALAGPFFRALNSLASRQRLP